MDTADEKLLVQLWIEYHTDAEASSELFWAWEQVNETVNGSPEEGWPLIMALVEAAPNYLVLASVAVGPLEDLIVKHSEQFIARIEVLARQSENFRKSLTGVWCDGDIPNEIQQRIQRYTAKVNEPL